MKFVKFLRIVVYTEVSSAQDFQLRVSMHFSYNGMYFWRLKICYLSRSLARAFSLTFLILARSGDIDDSRFRVVSTERQYIVTYSKIEHTKIQNITLKHKN